MLSSDRATVPHLVHNVGPFHTKYKGHRHFQNPSNKSSRSQGLFKGKDDKHIRKYVSTYYCSVNYSTRTYVIIWDIWRHQIDRFPSSDVLMTKYANMYVTFASRKRQWWNREPLFDSTPVQVVENNMRRQECSVCSNLKFQSKSMKPLSFLGQKPCISESPVPTNKMAFRTP